MIYLDYNATTPIAPEAAAAMKPFFAERFGNPSSSHEAGQRVKLAVDHARLQVADLLGCQTGEVVFTASGTEANNQVVKGMAHLHRGSTPHFVISAIEHPAIDAPCRFLEAYGVRTTRVPVDGTGLVNPDEVRRAITPDTVLISIMQANNEVGTIQPIAEIARIAHAAGALMHTDAAQSVGKLSVQVNELGVDFLSIAGHKLYAPQGIGALYVRHGTELPPLLHGAGHEGGRRAGTEAVPAIVGLGAAAELARTHPCSERITALRDRLFDRLVAALGDRVRLNGHRDLRLPNTLNVSFRGCRSSELLAAVPEICASGGSACHSGHDKPSSVLTAMGMAAEWALGAVRFSVGRYNTDDEIDHAAGLVAQAVRKPGKS